MSRVSSKPRARDILDRPSQRDIPLGLLEDSSLVALESHRSLGRVRSDQNGFYTDCHATRESTVEYQKCFYDARNMRESNVLKRTYRPLATILRLVRAWAEARKTSTADWHPIGVKARSHAPSKIGAYL